MGAKLCWLAPLAGMLVAACTSSATVHSGAPSVGSSTGQHSGPVRNVHVVPSTPTRPSESASAVRAAGNNRRSAAYYLIGSSGPIVWKLTHTALVVSRTAGDQWSRVTLPAHVQAKQVSVITAAPHRGLWLGLTHRRDIEVDHLNLVDHSWSRGQRLTADRHERLEGTSLTALITLGPDHVVGVLGVWGFTATGAYSDAFESTNNGASFTERPTQISFYIQSLTYLDADHALAIAGPLDQFLFKTVNAGRTWTQANTPGRRTSGTTPPTFYFPPIIEGGALQLPADTARRAHQRLSIDRTTDEGATLSPTGPPLQVPPQRSGTIQHILSQKGLLAWMPTQHRIYHSTNAGRTWTSVPTDTSVTSLSIINSTTAIGIVDDFGCAGPVHCSTADTYLVKSTNTGRTWRPI